MVMQRATFQVHVYDVSGMVTGTDEFIEFADLDFRSNTSTIYVFYPGLTIEAVSETDGYDP